MTEKSYDVSPTGALVKKPGWFSWRHRVRDQHDAATSRYLANHGPAARRERAAEREAARR